MKISVITSAYNQAHLIQKTLIGLEMQTFTDFEWIIADDGSVDGLKQWVSTKFDGIEGKFPVKYVAHEKNIGYRYGQIINKAVEVAEGEYLVIINADSYPAPDFLEQLLKVLEPNRLVAGVRMNVNDEGTVVSEDWRLSTVFYDEKATKLNVGIYPNVWTKMTLNSMGISRELFKNLGGMYDGYLGYGKEDWDLCMRAYFAGAECWWALTAILYTENHPGREDTPANTAIFEKRLEEFRAKSSSSEKEKLMRQKLNDPAAIQRSKDNLEQKKKILESDSYEEEEDL